MSICLHLEFYAVQQSCLPWKAAREASVECMSGCLDEWHSNNVNISYSSQLITEMFQLLFASHRSECFACVNSQNHRDAARKYQL